MRHQHLAVKAGPCIPDKMEPQKLKRQTFETSRALEFFTEKELNMQLGYERELWPITLMKECADNGLGGCEMAGVAPEIEITVERNSFSVRDNGPGLPESTMLRSMDYLVRVSDKAYYVSPTRGQIGNAAPLKGGAGLL